MYHFEPLTAYLDHLNENFLIPACDMAVMKGGEIIYRHSAGYSDLKKMTKVSAEDIYSIYSSTKISTCVAAMRLIQDGQLGLDDPVSKYLPAYEKLTVKEADGTVRPAETVMTVRHLMSMQGGLDYDMKRGNVEKVLEEKGDQAGTVDVVNTFAQAPLIFDPGTHYQYSLCHDVLAAVIEVASGMRYSDYLDEVIYRPLGMKNTTFHPTEEQLRHCSHLYRKNDAQDELIDEGLCRESYPTENYESGGGGLLSTVDDYLELAYALAHEGTGRNGYQLLKPETVELYRTRQLSETSQSDFLNAFSQMAGYTYCLGVRRFIDNSGSTCPLGHFGWDGAAGFYVMIDPENDLAYIYAQNVLNSGITFHQIHGQLRDLLYTCMRE